MWKFNRWLSFSIINYFYFGVKLMGIAHFKFDSKTNRFIPSPFSTLYGILVFLSIFVLLPLSTYEFMLLDVYFLNTPMTFIEFAKSLDMSRSTIIHMAAYVTFMFYRKEWPVLLNEGIDLYRATNEASEQDFFGSDGKFLVVFLIKFVKGWLPCFGVINSFLSYAEYYQFHGLDYIVKMLEWIIFMLTLIDNSFLSTIYMCGILYAAHLYRLLNTRLQVITQQLRWCDGITISECCFLSDKVDELSQIYLRITKFTQKFNALFSPLLLVMFFCNFTSTVFEMFYLYLNFVVSEIPFELDATQNIGDIIFLISGALQICFVIYAGNKISERVSWSRPSIPQLHFRNSISICRPGKQVLSYAFALSCNWTNGWKEVSVCRIIGVTSASVLLN